MSPESTASFGRELLAIARAAGGDTGVAIPGAGSASHLDASAHTAAPGDADSPLTHVEDFPARAAISAPWPEWVHPPLRAHWEARGIVRPYCHQVEAAELARSGHHVVLATGTASGKSLAYLMPALTRLSTDPQATTLYLAPTKALGTDQRMTVTALCDAVAGLGSVAPSPYDGDTPTEIRDHIRQHSRFLFSNPDMLHTAILRNHQRWAGFLRHLSFIVIDECHSYRGVFGSHVALVIRRLLRLCRRWGARPVVILASATTADPGAAATRLVGEPVREVIRDGSPQGARTIALWEPGFFPALKDGDGAPVRRPATSDAARIMAGLVAEGAHTLSFVRSRRAAETTAASCRAALIESGHAELAPLIASYRAGYLAAERLELERRLNAGELRGVATTNALELGIDISGLDAVIVGGFPGTVASFWQQAGRAGRRGQGALVLLIGRDDPLDTYVVNHPESLLHRPVEATVTDPGNPYVLGPHLLCAAVEHPLSPAEIERWGAGVVAADLAARGLLRWRGEGWFPAGGVDSAHSAVDLRGTGGPEVVIAEGETGRVIGTIDNARALGQVYDGAVYVHQGESFVVDTLDHESGLALVHSEAPEYTTVSRETTQIRVVDFLRREHYGPVTAGLATVTVTHQVVDYQRKVPGGQILDTIPLDLPPQELATQAVYLTITARRAEQAGVDALELPGALHAAEHAAIGLMPLIATCDRWDIGGVSIALHEDTGEPSIFVYDGNPGGAGFAERGFDRVRGWLGATLATIQSCRCESGCPSCVHSPKCGNGNSPLSKGGARLLLLAILEELGEVRGAEAGG